MSGFLLYPWQTAQVRSIRVPFGGKEKTAEAVNRT
jgi:hypothetical protein